MSLQRNPISRVGSGEVAGEQVMTVKPEEQTDARQSAGTVVKSPSASALGESIYHQGPLHDTLSGADEHAPSFSRGLTLLESAAAERERDVMLDYERLQEERIKAVRESGMRALRIEAERTNEALAKAAEAKERAEFLERQLAEEYSKPRRAWLVSAVLSFGFWAGVFWVVAR